MRIENSGKRQEALFKCINYYMETSLCAMCNGYTAIQRRAAETETTGRSIIRSMPWMINLLYHSSSFLILCSAIFSLPSSTSGLPIIFFFFKAPPNFIPSLAGSKNSHSLLRLTKTVKNPGWSRPSVYCTVLQDRDVPAWNQFIVSQENTKSTRAQALGCS